MAFVPSQQNRQHFQRDDREGTTYVTDSTFMGRGGTSGSGYQHQRDNIHHDYTNITTSRNKNDLDNDSPFVPISTGDSKREFRHQSHPNVGMENDPSSPNVKVVAPTFHDRRGREGGDRWGRTRPREENTRHGSRLFEDTEFLPNISSVYFSRELKNRHSIQWMRPERISSQPVFVHGRFDTFDVVQGALGDCWFVAAMACLCNPDNYRLLQRVVPVNSSFQEGYDGHFSFSFWHFGEWREIVIDDYLPTVGGALIFVHSTRRNEFWPALMEKAYSKLYGSYEALKSGLMADSLTDLTGGVAETYKLRGQKANYPSNIITVLFKALDRGALIGCGIDGAGQGESKLPSGLIAGHAYSVTAIQSVPLPDGDIVLIRIRNPHGTNEWHGHWSDRSTKWQQIHPDERARLGLIQRDDGEFWMSFDDFMRNFDTLDICNLSPDAPVSAPRKWYSVHHHGRWVKHFNAGGKPQNTNSHWANPQYVLKLEDTDEDDDSVCSVLVQLMQKDRRKIKQKGERFLFIGFVIYKVPSGYSVPLNREFFEHHNAFERSDAFTNARQVVKRFTLPPGIYVVVPSTWNKDEEANFYIRFFFEKGNVSEYADEPPERVEVPPPTPSPKYKEQEEQFKKFFYDMSGEDMEINCFELHKAVNHALSKEPLHREIGLDACRSFVSLMDVDNSGRLGFTEFQYLWNVLRSWKKVFLQHDVDNSGKMDSRELRTALAATGYKISNQMLAAAIFRCADAEGCISLDNFLILLAKLMKLFNVYKTYQKNDRGVFTLQQWVEESLRI